MSTPSPESVAAAEAALDTVRGDWMSRPEVVSVEVARSSRSPDGVCVRVVVDGSMADRSPDPPDLPDLPAAVGGVPVEVVVGGRPRLE